MIFVPRQCKGCQRFSPCQRMKDAIFGGERILGKCALDKKLYDAEHGCYQWESGSPPPVTTAVRHTISGRPKYTAEDIATLRAVSEAGGTMKEAANRVGRSTSSVASKAHALGIRFHGTSKYARHPYALGLPDGPRPAK